MYLVWFNALWNRTSLRRVQWYHALYIRGSRRNYSRKWNRVQAKLSRSRFASFTGTRVLSILLDVCGKWTISRSVRLHIQDEKPFYDWKEWRTACSQRNSNRWPHSGMADKLILFQNVDMIMCLSATGKMARMISKYRPKQPVTAYW